MERFSLTIHHPRPTIHLFEMAKAKLKTIYSCQSCGHQTSKWLGKCPDCNSWNSFVEEIKVKDEVSEIPFFEFKTEDAIALTDVTLDHYQRIPTHLPELDRVLGSGIVPGSLILLGGDPGIGKSTLVLQALNKLAESGVTVLYATGEESREQIKMRANRLNIHASIYVVAENSIERILNQVQKIKPQVLVVDSIQTVYLQNLESAPGSISQVRECAGKLLYLSKTQNIATLLIGHVTKEGALAGPRVLEHMVDTVLYFEGDSRQQCRILRSIKNRFGSTNEIGVFEMTGDGLVEVSNPSLFFMPERSQSLNGSTITAALEGVRPFLVEIQALVSDSSLTNPRRTTLGVDSGRVALVIAVLEKIIGLNLYNQDVYVNAAGGFKIMEPSADAAILAALVSSFRNKPLPNHTLILGEIGLTGEIRGVMGADIRLSEASKLGFTHCILPKNNKKIIHSSQMKISLVDSVSDLLNILF